MDELGGLGEQFGKMTSGLTSGAGIALQLLVMVLIVVVIAIGGYLLWWYMKHKNTIDIYDMTGSVPIMRRDKFSIDRGNDSITSWHIWRMRLLIKPSGPEAISVDEKGRLHVFALRTPQGAFTFLKPDLPRMESEIKSWEAKFQPAKAEDRAFLAYQIQKAMTRNAGNWIKQNLLPMISIGSLTLVIIVAIVFGDKLFAPIERLHGSNLEIAQQNAKMMQGMAQTQRVQLDMLVMMRSFMAEKCGVPLSDLGSIPVANYTGLPGIGIQEGGPQ